MSDHILIVDDDQRLRSLLEQYLSKAGYVVSSAGSSLEAEELLRYFAVDLMILDVMMPGETGMELAQRRRDLPPVLMLTAMGEADDRVSGLEAGVQDYMVKPFEPRELLLRLQNILQRAGKKDSDVLRFGPFRFALAQQRLFKDEQEIYLTSAEQSMLLALARRCGKPVSREELAELGGASANERSVDVQINRLRKKIETIPGRLSYIRTVRHAGYALQVEE